MPVVSHFLYISKPAIDPVSCLYLSGIHYKSEVLNFKCLISYTDERRLREFLKNTTEKKIFRAGQNFWIS